MDTLVPPTPCGVGMVRKLKYHEKKLLKKVDFVTWKADPNHREVQVMRRYHLQKREDYSKYTDHSQVCNM